MVLVMLVAALLGAPAVEPTLAEAQAAAARLVAGDASDDASRAVRARRSHWAPVVRAQVGGRQEERVREGELRLGPVHDQAATVGTQWSVLIAWDFAQTVYAREEAQLALAHAQLARARREAQEKVARLYAERLRLSRASGRADALLELLRVTGELDALTGGLFHDALARVQAELEGK